MSRIIEIGGRFYNASLIATIQKAEDTEIYIHFAFADGGSAGNVPPPPKMPRIRVTYAFGSDLVHADLDKAIRDWQNALGADAPSEGPYR